MIERQVQVIGNNGNFYAAYEVVTLTDAEAVEQGMKFAKADGCENVEAVEVIHVEGQRHG